MSIVCGDRGQYDPINSYGLVAYIPDPLGSFLNELRSELVKSCHARSHVSVLPPRSLAGASGQIARVLGDALMDFESFSLELTGVRVFESTSVIHLGVGRGASELEAMHARLNRAELASLESHRYSPHITLAQDFPPKALDQMVLLAQERWAAFTGRRAFEVNRLTFVQNTVTNHWLDLAEYPLALPVGAKS